MHKPLDSLSIQVHAAYVNDLKCKRKYLAAYKYSQKLLDKNLIEDRNAIEDIRDQLIDYFKDDYIIFPADRIAAINSSHNRKKIILSITTCKRFDLFSQTINSFINCCKDLDLIDHWLCVDDNSSEGDRQKMRELYPFFEFIFKNENDKGHFSSMNIIYDKVSEGKYDYIVHLEDDWHFINRLNYIGDALQILNEDPQVGQVLFNKYYAEVESYKRRIGSGRLDMTKNGLRYIRHEYFEPNTNEYREYMKRQSPPNSAYWPHFSFRPSVLRCSVLRDIGHFYNTPHFEMAYAREYALRGHRSVFFDNFCCIHIGKKTWEKTAEVNNAYSLNKTDQFVLSNNDMPIAVISDNQCLDRWRSFKKSAHGRLTSYTRCVLRPITELSPYEKQLFLGNRFQYSRDIMNQIMTQVDILSTANSSYVIVLFDHLQILDGFTQKINTILDNIDQHDVIILENLDKFEGIKLDDRCNQYSLFKSGYLITQKGIRTLLGFIEVNGIKDPNDLFRACKTGMVNECLVKSGNVLTGEANIEMCSEDYEFYSNMDSFGNDIAFVGPQSINDLKSLAESIEGCAGFNTLGYLKSQICDESNFIYLPHSRAHSDGLYVIKSRRKNCK